MEVRSWALSNNLPRGKSDNGELDHEVSGSNEKQPYAGIGSLVKLEIADQGHEVFCYITEYEGSSSDLPKSIQDCLPDHTKVSPLIGRPNVGTVIEPDNLAQRLQGKKAGAEIELLNSKTARVISIEQLST